MLPPFLKEISHKKGWVPRNMQVIAGFIKLNIRTIISNMSNSNYELIESENELNEPTTSNFWIEISVELRTANSNANY